MIFFVTEDPVPTDTSPLFEREKSNVVGGVEVTVDEDVGASVPPDVVTTVWLWPSV